MVNLFFYLNSEEDAEKLVSALLRERLVAHAAITPGNETVRSYDNKIVVKHEYVITAQTKALLFDEVSAFVNKNHGGDIRIFSVPIAQCNEAFSARIRQDTKDPG